MEKEEGAKQHETDVALQLDPFSSFLRPPEPKRAETENRRRERERGKNKEMMKSPLQEEGEREQHMWSFLAPCRKRKTCLKGGRIIPIEYIFKNREELRRTQSAITETSTNVCRSRQTHESMHLRPIGPVQNFFFYQSQLGGQLDPIPPPHSSFSSSSFIPNGLFPVRTRKGRFSLSRSLCVLSISTGAPPNASSDSFNNLDDTPRGRQLSNAPRAERPLWLPVVKPGKKEKYIFLRRPSQQ